MPVRFWPVAPNIMIPYTTNRQDKFGFYRVGNFKTYSRLEAMLIEQRTNNPMRWVFNDDVYSSCNWLIEPTTSLEELYRQRAQQLRDKYDYIVLWYSGGADSANILNAFVNNDIKLDEVLSFVNYSITKDKEHITNAEIFYVADPTIKKLQAKQPWIKYRVEDIAEVMEDTYANISGIDWIYDLNGFITPHSLGKQELKLKIPEWKNMYESGKTVCHVFGIDKPIVKQVGNQFFFHFIDRVDNAVTPKAQRLDRPWEHNELFYWTPDLPEIVVKQAHVIKNYLKTLTPEDVEAVKNIDFESKEWGPHNITTEWTRGAPYVKRIDASQTQRSFLTYETIHKLIYPGWEPIPYQIKTRGLVFSDKDDWFWNTTGLETAKQNHLVGLEELWKKTPNKYKHNANSLSRGFKSKFSQVYLLGS